GSRHKKFKTSHDAEAWIAQNGGPSNAASLLLASTSTSTTSTVERRSRPYPETRPMVSKKGKERDEVVVRTEREGWLLVYCDGACKGNGKPGSIAGIGVWWGPDDPRNIAERCPGSQTNNRAELIAIVRVLQTTPLSKTPLQILTDSQYSMKCGIGIKEWLQKWKRNGYKNSKGEPVSNRAIIEYIDALLNERGALGQRVEFEYVPGHSGYEGNEGADYLANCGSQMESIEEPDWDALREEVERRIRDIPVDAQPAMIVTPSKIVVQPKSSATRDLPQKPTSTSIESQPRDSAHPGSTISSATVVPKRYAKYEATPVEWLTDSAKADRARDFGTGTQVTISYSIDGFNHIS
ncbi:ribonuclease H-like protein, partial [Panus rudis PR-1116 ss-1]